MNKKSAPPPAKAISPKEKFERFVSALIRVPKKEIDEKKNPREKGWRKGLVEVQKLVKKNSTHQTQKQAKPKTQANHPANNWPDVIKQAVLDLHKSSWLQNLVVGLAFLFLALGITAFVNSKQAGVIVIALGLTIILWIFAGAIYFRIGHYAPPPNSQPGTATPPLAPVTSASESLVSNALEKQDAKQDAAQVTLNAILAKMETYQKQHAPDLSKDFPLGYSLFTMKGRSEIIPFRGTLMKDELFDWKEASVEVGDTKIIFTPPGVTIGH